MLLSLQHRPRGPEVPPSNELGHLGKNHTSANSRAYHEPPNTIVRMQAFFTCLH